MLHRDFPPGVTTATICAYFQVGIEAGLVPYENSKDWAFSVIEQLDAPPIEIIEIATANQSPLKNAAEPAAVRLLP